MDMQGFFSANSSELFEYYCNKYHVQAVTLDVLANGGETSFTEIYNSVNKLFYTNEVEKLPLEKFVIYVAELATIGLIMRCDNCGEDDITDELQEDGEIILKITDAGLLALKNQTFHSNTTSALAARESLKLNRRTVWLSVFTLIVSIVAIFASIYIPVKINIQYDNRLQEIERQSMSLEEAYQTIIDKVKTMEDSTEQFKKDTLNRINDKDETKIR